MKIAMYPAPHDVPSLRWGLYSLMMQIRHEIDPNHVHWRQLVEPQHSQNLHTFVRGSITALRTMLDETP